MLMRADTVESDRDVIKAREEFSLPLKAGLETETKTKIKRGCQVRQKADTALP
jgi:hypothetical protein